MAGRWGVLVAMAALAACRSEPAAPTSPAETASAPGEAAADEVLRVVATWPGASPDEIEPRLAEPIERALMALHEASRLETTITAGRCEIVLHFAGEAPLVAVRDALAALAPELPPEVPPPVVSRDGAGEVEHWLVLRSDAASQSELYTLARALADRLATAAGVRETRLCAGGEPEVQVALDAARLPAYGLTTLEAVSAIQAALSAPDVPAGRLQGGGAGVQIRAAAGPRSLDGLGDVVVTARDGALVTLRDLAQIARHAAPAACTAADDGAPVALVAAIGGPEPALGELRATLPPGATLREVGPERARAMQREPGVGDAAPTLELTVDRAVAARLGMDVDDVTRAAEVATSGAVVGRLDDAPIRVVLGGSTPREALDALRVRGTSGAEVPLSAIVRATIAPASPPRHRVDGRRVEGE